MTKLSDKMISAGIVAIRQLLEDGTKIERHSHEGFTLTKPNGTVYTVDLTYTSCDCPAIRTCKHIKVCIILSEIMI